MSVNTILTADTVVQKWILCILTLVRAVMIWSPNYFTLNTPIIFTASKLAPYP